MTTDELRDLNRRVALLLGATWKDVRIRGGTSTVPVLTADSFWHSDGVHTEKQLRAYRVPDYSTDISSAWLVVERMRVDGLSAMLYVHDKAIHEIRFACEFLKEVTEAEGGNKWTPHKRHGGVGPTMPEAICLAACAAKGA